MTRTELPLPKRDAVRGNGAYLNVVQLLIVGYATAKLSLLWYRFAWIKSNDALNSKHLLIRREER
jgi:hypothetical protein